MSNENKLQDIIKTSLENISTLIDANTVVGNPISTDNGVTIIPVSKVSMGFASGGLDYNKEKDEKANDKKAVKFGGGGGTGLNISPVGFLVIKADGKIEMVNITAKPPADPVEQIAEIIERSPEIIGKIKDLFVKDKDAKNDK